MANVLKERRLNLLAQCETNSKGNGTFVWGGIIHGVQSDMNVAVRGKGVVS